MLLFISVTVVGGYLLYVEWSGHQVPGSPFKVTITMKGNNDKVKVEGHGLKGGYVGQELRAIVDTSEAGSGIVQCYYLLFSSKALQPRKSKYGQHIT